MCVDWRSASIRRAHPVGVEHVAVMGRRLDASERPAARTAGLEDVICARDVSRDSYEHGEEKCDAQPTVEPHPLHAMDAIMHEHVVACTRCSFRNKGGRNPTLAGSWSVEYSTVSGLSRSTA